MWVLYHHEFEKGNSESVFVGNGTSIMGAFHVPNDCNSVALDDSYVVCVIRKGLLVVLSFFMGSSKFLGYVTWTHTFPKILRHTKTQNLSLRNNHHRDEGYWRHHLVTAASMNPSH